MNSAKVETSWRLQLLVEIFKEANWPLSADDIGDLSINRITGKRRLVAVGTRINELRDNAGYVVAGRRVHDGRHFVFWLEAAPGWRPRWSVTSDLRVVSPQAARAALHSAEATLVKEVEKPPVVLADACAERPVCMGCGAVLSDELLCEGSKCCDDVCRKKWRAGLFGAVSDGELKLM